MHEFIGTGVWVALGLFTAWRWVRTLPKSGTPGLTLILILVFWPIIWIAGLAVLVYDGFDWVARKMGFKDIPPNRWDYY